MSWKEAAEFIMPFGKYKGKTLDDIASTDHGLLYLDWLQGEREEQRSSTALDIFLKEYLQDSTIKQELNDILRRRGNRP